MFMPKLAIFEGFAINNGYKSFNVDGENGSNFKHFMTKQKIKYIIYVLVVGIIFSYQLVEIPKGVGRCGRF